MTANFLHVLVENAEQILSNGYYSMAASSSRPGSFERSLLRCPQFPIIPEIKLSSPSLNEISSHSPSHLAACYLRAGAPCLSVLTEPNFFGGSLENLESIAAMGVPVLMKDIVVSEIQIDAASALGASSILLIQSIFELEGYHKRREALLEHAHSLGLEVILEVTNERELRLAMESASDMIGINQRNLSDLSLDKEKGGRLLPLCQGEGKPIIVMSGLERMEEVERLRDQGAAAVLIGTHLSQSKRPEDLLRSMVVSR